MKNIIKLLGIAAIIAVIGFSMATCDNGSGGGDGNRKDVLDGTTWISVGTYYNVTLKFNSPNVVMTGANDGKSVYRGTYTISGNTVTITSADWGGPEAGTLSGNILIINDTTFIKQGGGGGESGGNGSLGSTLTITNAQVYSVEYNDGYQFFPFNSTVNNLKIYNYEDSSLNEIIDGNPIITLVNGKLNVTLGTPKISSLKDPTLPPGITASTSGVKMFQISGFTDGPPNATNVFQDKWEINEQGRAICSVDYYYVNKDVKISGTSGTTTVAMNLKAGWNSVFFNTTQTGNTMETGTPPADYRWMAYPH